MRPHRCCGRSSPTNGGAQSSWVGNRAGWYKPQKTGAGIAAGPQCACGRLTGVVFGHGRRAEGGGLPGHEAPGPLAASGMARRRQSSRARSVSPARGRARPDLLRNAACGRHHGRGLCLEAPLPRAPIKNARDGPRRGKGQAYGGCETVPGRVSRHQPRRNCCAQNHCRKPPRGRRHTRSPCREGTSGHGRCSVWQKACTSRK